MKIGIVQFAPELANLRGTIKRLEDLCEGKSLGDLIVLPELCNSGYSFQDRTQAWASSENCSDSHFLRFLQAMCQRHQCQIVSGFNERDGDRLYNTAVLVGQEGLIGKYRKMHLFLDEQDYFEPGDTGLGIWEIQQCRIGMLICFDWLFPEVWRILALKGADIICHPSNLVLPGLAQRGIPAHAMMNRVFTVTANRIGTERDLTFTGNSIICDPRGNIVAHAPADDECILAVEIDPAEARDKMITSRNHVFNDRRPGEYSDLAK